MTTVDNMRAQGGGASYLEFVEIVKGNTIFLSTLRVVLMSSKILYCNYRIRLVETTTPKTMYRIFYMIWQYQYLITVTN